MDNILTSAPVYGDSDNTLWLKIAQAYYSRLSNPSTYRAPVYGDSTNQLIFKTASYFF